MDLLNTVYTCGRGSDFSESIIEGTPIDPSLITFFFHCTMSSNLFPIQTPSYILAFQFSSWYPKFSNQSIKSTIVRPLSQEFIDYLNSESVFVPEGSEDLLVNLHHCELLELMNLLARPKAHFQMRATTKKNMMMSQHQGGTRFQNLTSKFETA